MKMCHVVFGAAYIGPYSEWSWVNVLGVIGVGILLVWILYRLVLSRIDWGSKREKTKEEVKRVVITEQNLPDEEGITPIHQVEEGIDAEEVIAMPFSGELIVLSKVPDPMFSEKMMGDGFAIKPYKGVIVSPVNGIVQDIQSNKTAITFNTRTGREVILHIGLRSAHLTSDMISLDIKEGTSVEAGKQIGNIDLDKMGLESEFAISPVVFPNLKEGERVVVKQEGIVEAGMEKVVFIEISKTQG